MTGITQIASYFHYTAILCNDINYMVCVLFIFFPRIICEDSGNLSLFSYSENFSFKFISNKKKDFDYLTKLNELIICLL